MGKLVCIKQWVRKWGLCLFAVLCLQISAINLALAVPAALSQVAASQSQETLLDPAELSQQSNLQISIADELAMESDQFAEVVDDDADIVEQARAVSEDPNYPYLSWKASEEFPADVLAQGEYLAKLSGCVSCHTDQAHKTPALGGGLVLNTPYGELVTPNISADKHHGIGLWTAENFVEVMQQGHRLGGYAYLPPSMADSFAKMSKQDLISIYGYLMSVPPAAVPRVRSHYKGFYRLPWTRGFKYRTYFKAGSYEYRPEKTAEWNRGAYLTEAVLACGSCHTPRNWGGAMKVAKLLRGGDAFGIKAPNLTQGAFATMSVSGKAAALQTLAKQPVSDWRSDHSRLSAITDQDLQSVSVYLQTLSPKPTKPVTTTPQMGATNKPELARGQEIYQQHCQSCHESGQNGAPKMGDKTAWKSIIKKDMVVLYQHTIDGYNLMPANGGCEDCQKSDVLAAVRYMVAQNSEKDPSLW